LKDPNNYFAILSDIHANIDALQAVLADIEHHTVRGILCLGDIVGYGSEPAACVNLMMERSAVTVLGNHEAMLLLADKVLDEDWDVSVRKPLRIAKDTVSEEGLGWLKDLPITADLDPITLCHASLNEPPEFHYLNAHTEVEAHFAAQETFVAFGGHTHLPSRWEENPDAFSCREMKVLAAPVRLREDRRYAVNVGSVGQPRDGDPRASYALYDFETRTLLHRRVAYDVKKAQARYKKSGIPAHNAARLSKGE